MNDESYEFSSITRGGENFIESNPPIPDGKKLTFDPNAFAEYKPYSLFHNGKIVVIIKIKGQIITHYISAPEYYT